MKTQQELEANYDRFIGIIKKYFTGERLEKLLHMYSEDELGTNLTISPASGSKHYHNAHFGGYIDHIFNVCKNSMKMKELFIAQGGIIDFTDEELIFCALHHDLGKLGILGEMHYIPNDNEYRIVVLTKDYKPLITKRKKKIAEEVKTLRYSEYKPNCDFLYDKPIYIVDIKENQFGKYNLPEGWRNWEDLELVFDYVNMKKNCEHCKDSLDVCDSCKETIICDECYIIHDDRFEDEGGSYPNYIYICRECSSKI